MNPGGISKRPRLMSTQLKKTVLDLRNHGGENGLVITMPVTACQIQ